MSTTKAHVAFACRDRFRSTLLTVLFALFCLGVLSARAETQVIKIGVYENAPKIFTSESGSPAGIFIDIIEHIAEKEGWNLQYISGTWGEGLDRLAKGELDLMPDVAYNTAVKKYAPFTKLLLCPPGMRYMR